ncbi:IS982 family transposase, partial [Paeniglutamicibacter cryotolerans]
LDTLATALYACADDFLKANPHLLPWRPAIGFGPRISDAELVTIAVLQALLGFTSERRWLRQSHNDLRRWFPDLPQQPGYNKRLRKLGGTLQALNEHLAHTTGLWSDELWLADSTPVECGRSHTTAHRSELAGWAEYGYCASHSRWFWGLRLHLLCTPTGLPVGYALTGAKADERETLLGILENLPTPVEPGQIIIADKNYYGKAFEQDLSEAGITLVRPTRQGEKPRPGKSLLKPLRQVIESINDTLKGQLDLEAHGGRTIAGVTVRVLQRILALTVAIWHNLNTGSHPLRSLTAYDHEPLESII